MASNTGSEALTRERDFDKAKKLIAEGGQKGEKITVLAEFAANDWGNLVISRASTRPSAKAAGMDEKLEPLRSQWTKATDSEARQEIASRSRSAPLRSCPIFLPVNGKA